MFVSRLNDGLPQHFMSGLLSLGDEILEINGRGVADLSLDQCYELMSQQDPLTLKLLPYAIRQTKPDSLGGE